MYQDENHKLIDRMEDMRIAHAREVTRLQSQLDGALDEMVRLRQELEGMRADVARFRQLRRLQARGGRGF